MKLYNKKAEGWGGVWIMFGVGLALVLACLLFSFSSASAATFQEAVLDHSVWNWEDCSGGNHTDTWYFTPTGENTNGSAIIWAWHVEGSGIECTLGEVLLNGDPMRRVNTDNEEVLGADYDIFVGDALSGQENEISYTYGGTGRKVFWGYSVIDGVWSDLLATSSSWGEDWTSPKAESLSLTASQVNDEGAVNFLVFGVVRKAGLAITGDGNQTELLNGYAYEMGEYMGFKTATTTGAINMGVSFAPTPASGAYLYSFALPRHSAPLEPWLYPFNFNYGAMSCCEGVACEIPYSYELWANGSTVNAGYACYGQELASTTVWLTRTLDENALVIPADHTNDATTTKLCYWGTYWDADRGTYESWESRGHILNIMSSTSDMCRWDSVLEARYSNLCAELDEDTVSGAIQCAFRKTGAFFFRPATSSVATYEKLLTMLGGTFPYNIRSQLQSVMDTQTSSTTLEFKIPMPAGGGTINWIRVFSSSSMPAAIGQQNFDFLQIFIKLSISLAAISWLLFRFVIPKPHEE